MTTSPTNPRWRNWLAKAALPGAVVFAILVVAIGLGILSNDESNLATETTPVTTTTVSATVTTTVCAHWMRSDTDKGNNRWVANGLPSIATASTPEEARAASQDWVNMVRQDPILLAGAVKVMLGQETDQTGLFDASGCATKLAADLTAQLGVKISLSNVTPSEAPANGYNSGVHEGQVVAAAQPGVTGNRKAILIETPDGAKIWIMQRCGNVVTEGPPPVPPGPTDNPPPPPQVPTTTPPTSKPPLSRSCMQNGGPECPAGVNRAIQPPQNNQTSGVNTGPTPGAPAQPHQPQPGPAPQPSTPAPTAVPGGYNSGSPTGSGTPGGHTQAPDGTTTGGGPKPAPPGTSTNSGQGGSNDGTITNPW